MKRGGRGLYSGFSGKRVDYMTEDTSRKGKEVRERESGWEILSIAAYILCKMQENEKYLQI